MIARRRNIDLTPSSFQKQIYENCNLDPWQRSLKDNFIFCFYVNPYKPLLLPPSFEEIPQVWLVPGEISGCNVYGKWKQGEKSAEICHPVVPAALPNLFAKTVL